MKKYFLKIIPGAVLKAIRDHRSFAQWKKRDFLESSPQLVKEKIFLKYGIKNANWIETGTYLGTTTNFLSELYPYVYSIEPEPQLYKSASKRFAGRNIKLFNDVSENVLPSLLNTLKGDINFWLDGHYSKGITFKGSKNCPVEEELEAIEKSFANFNKITILIDDVRLFHTTNTDYNNYPSINYLVD